MPQVSTAVPYTLTRQGVVMAPDPENFTAVAVAAQRSAGGDRTFHVEHDPNAGADVASPRTRTNPRPSRPRSPL